MLLEDAIVGLCYRVRVEGTENWAEGTLTKKKQDDNGTWGAWFDFFDEDGPHVAEIRQSSDLLEMERIPCP